MFIGQVSELSGATRKAIRHYEAIGLIVPPKRNGSYRVYTEHDVTVIAMIRRAQALGFSLSELKDVVSRKTIDKKLPVDLIASLIDQKAHKLRQNAEHLLAQAEALEKLKIDLFRQFP